MGLVTDSKKVTWGLVKPTSGMYKPAKFRDRDRFCPASSRPHKPVLSVTWSNENGCTKKKNKPVQARYAPLC